MHTTPWAHTHEHHATCAAASAGELTVTGWPVLAGVHLSPAGDTSGFHLPVLATGAGVVLAAVGPLVGVAAGAVGATAGVGDVVAGVVAAFVGAGVGVRVGALVGPPFSSVRPLRAALAGAASRQNAEMRAHTCVVEVAQGHKRTKCCA
jgi:hypothetical protein